MFGHSGAFAFFRCPLESLEFWDCSCSFFSHCIVFWGIFLLLHFLLEFYAVWSCLLFVCSFLDFLEGFVIFGFWVMFSIFVMSLSRLLLFSWNCFFKNNFDASGTFCIFGSSEHCIDISNLCAEACAHAICEFESVGLVWFMDGNVWMCSGCWGPDSLELSLSQERVWVHDFAGVTVNLACRVTQMSIEAHIGLCQHNVRQGWRAWIFQRWSNSGRHELRALPAVTPQVFRSLQFDDVRAWALSAAPAATVALGATFSPAHWSFVPSSPCQFPSALCPWGCGETGFWDHICWSCRCRPSHAPRRPLCAFLARFGWSTKENTKDDISKVRSWLLVCQNALWQQRKDDTGWARYGELPCYVFRGASARIKVYYFPMLSFFSLRLPQNRKGRNQGNEMLKGCCVFPFRDTFAFRKLPNWKLDKVTASRIRTEKNEIKSHNLENRNIKSQLLQMPRNTASSNLSEAKALQKCKNFGSCCFTLVSARTSQHTFDSETSPAFFGVVMFQCFWSHIFPISCWWVCDKNCKASRFTCCLRLLISWTNWRFALHLVRVCVFSRISKECH